MGKSLFTKDGRKLTFSEFYEKYGVLLVFLLEVILFSIISDKFLSATNILNVLRQIAMTGILAIGMTFVCITAGIDLSVGNVGGCGKRDEFYGARHSGGIGMWTGNGRFERLRSCSWKNAAVCHDAGHHVDRQRNRVSVFKRIADYAFQFHS